MVAIAHRPSILNVVDRLLVLREGAIAGFGPTQEVMRQLNQGQAGKLAGKGKNEKMTPRRLTMQRKIGDQSKSHAPGGEQSAKSDQSGEKSAKSDQAGEQSDKLNPAADLAQADNKSAKVKNG